MAMSPKPLILKINFLNRLGNKKIFCLLSGENKIFLMSLFFHSNSIVCVKGALRCRCITVTVTYATLMETVVMLLGTLI